MINIFVVWKSDHFISVAKKILCNRNINVSGICTNADNAIEDFRKCKPKPDILLLDAHWGDSTISTEIILSKFLGLEPVKVIITATFFEQHYVNKFKAMEVKGFFYRNQGIDEIINCIYSVYNHKFSFPDK
jgi:DNA-binding NarL/FixJ family response regulator